MTQTDSFNPFPQTFSAWEDLYVERKHLWIPQVSKYNTVYLDEAVDVFYKIREPVSPPGLLERCAQYGVTPSSHEAEDRALTIAQTIGLSVPQKHSFVSRTSDVGTKSVLATSRIGGITVDELINDLKVDGGFKAGVVRSMHCSLLSVAFAFEDADRDKENTRVFLLGGNKVALGFFDFQMAFSKGFGFQEKYVRNLFLISQKHAQAKPPREQMEEAFISLGEAIVTKENQIGKQDCARMYGNLQGGLAFTLQQLYP